MERRYDDVPDTAGELRGRPACAKSSKARSRPSRLGTGSHAPGTLDSDLFAHALGLVADH
jgi:hypothetical protein